MFGIWGNKPYRATDMALETEKGMYNIYSLYYQFSNGSIFNNSRRLLIL